MQLIHPVFCAILFFTCWSAGIDRASMLSAQENQSPAATESSSATDESGGQAKQDPPLDRLAQYLTGSRWEGQFHYHRSKQTTC